MTFRKPAGPPVSSRFRRVLNSNRLRPFRGFAYVVSERMYVVYSPSTVSPLAIWRSLYGALMNSYCTSSALSQTDEQEKPYSASAQILCPSGIKCVLNCSWQERTQGVKDRTPSARHSTLQFVCKGGASVDDG